MASNAFQNSQAANIVGDKYITPETRQALINAGRDKDPAIAKAIADSIAAENYVASNATKVAQATVSTNKYNANNPTLAMAVQSTAPAAAVNSELAKINVPAPAPVSVAPPVTSPPPTSAPSPPQTSAPSQTITAPTPNPVPAVYDYKTDPTFLAWKKDYDGMNALNLEQANKTWQEKYGGLQTTYDELNKNFDSTKGNLDKATSQLNEYMPYKDKVSELQKQLSTTQANFDDLNGRYTGLQKEQVKAINNQNGGSNPNATAPVNMQNYNDNRNAVADQWWGKYLTGRG